MAGPLIRRQSSGSGGGATKSRFNYKPRTAEELKERQRQQAGSRESFFGSDVQFYTSAQGDNDIRIMPPTWEDAKHYGMDLFVHYGIGADESAYLCLDAMGKGRCPICEERQRATGAGEQEYADSLRPSKRVAIYLINRKEEGKGPLVWNMPWTVDRDISNLSVDAKTGEVYPVDDPDSGFDVQFKREGQQQRTKYTGIQIARRNSPLSDNSETQEKWLHYLVEHPLPECLVFHDYEHVAQAFNAAVGSDTTIAERAANSPRVQEKREYNAKKSGDKPAAQSAGAGRAKLQPRVKEKEKEPEPEQTTDEQTPTWEELEKADVELLGNIGESFNLEFPEAGFETEDALRDWIAEQLGVEKPKAEAKAAPAAAAAKGDWRSRLKGMTKGK